MVLHPAAGGTLRWHMIRLGVVTDIHTDAAGGRGGAWHNPYDPHGTLARLEAALRAFEREGVDAVAVLGDLTNSGRPEEFAAAGEVLAACRLPIMQVPGNHDRQGEHPPPTPATARPGVVRVDLEGRWPGDRDLGFAFEPPSGPLGPAVVLSHYPVLSRRDALSAAGLKYAGDLGRRSELEAGVRALGDPVVALCGHLHVRDATAAAGLLQLGFGALIEYPYEAAVFSFDPAAGRAGRRCFAVGPHPNGDHGCDPRLSPAEQMWDMAGSEWIASLPGSAR